MKSPLILAILFSFNAKAEANRCSNETLAQFSRELGRLGCAVIGDISCLRAAQISLSAIPVAGGTIAMSALTTSIINQASKRAAAQAVVTALMGVTPASKTIRIAQSAGLIGFAAFTAKDLLSEAEVQESPECRSSKTPDHIPFRFDRKTNKCEAILSLASLRVRNFLKLSPAEQARELNDPATCAYYSELKEQLRIQNDEVEKNALANKLASPPKCLPDGGVDFTMKGFGSNDLRVITKMEGDSLRRVQFDILTPAKFAKPETQASVLAQKTYSLEYTKSDGGLNQPTMVRHSGQNQTFEDFHKTQAANNSDISVYMKASPILAARATQCCQAKDPAACFRGNFKMRDEATVTSPPRSEPPATAE